MYLLRSKCAFFGHVMAGLILSGCATPHKNLNLHATSPDDKSLAQVTHSIAGRADAQPSVRASAEDVKIAEQSQNLAKADFFPTVSLEADHSSGKTANGGRQDTDSANLAASFSVTRAATSMIELDAAKAETDLAHYEVVRTRDAAIIQLVGASEEETKALATLRTKKADINRLRKFLKRQKQRNKAGLVSRTDINRIQGSIASSQVDLSSFSKAYDSAVAARKRLIGNTEPITIRRDRLLKQVPSSAQDAVREALSENPVIRQAEAEVRIAEQGLAKTKVEILPSLDLYAKTDLKDSRSANSLDDEMGFKLSLPVFNGMRNSSRVRQEKSRVRKSKYRLEDVQQSVEIETQRLWHSVKGLQASIKHAESRVAAARKVVSGVQEGVRIGARDAANELAAYEELTEAEIDLVNRNYELTLQLHRLLASLGKLSTIYG